MFHNYSIAFIMELNFPMTMRETGAGASILILVCGRT